MKIITIFLLKQYNCPIFRLAQKYNDACKYELQMYREIFGKEITREKCMAEGDISCTYIIRQALNIKVFYYINKLTNYYIKYYTTQNNFPTI